MFGWFTTRKGRPTLKININDPRESKPLAWSSSVKYTQVHPWCQLMKRQQFGSVQLLSLCNPMKCSTPVLPVHHQLPEFTETHVHRVSDAIKPSHPLSSPSPPAPNPSQHQSFFQSQLFAWGGQSIGVSALASFLPKKSQGWCPSEWTVQKNFFSFILFLNFT